MTPLYSFALAVLMSSNAFSEKIVQHYGTLEIDWSTAKIRHSSAVTASQDDFSWESLDADARRQGLLHLKDRVVALNRSFGVKSGVVEVVAQEQAEKAGQTVETTTWLKNTEYDAQGRLAHHFENRLSRALYREDMRFLDEKTTAEQSPFTGLVLRVQGQIEPVALYKIVDENQQVLLSSEKVHKSAFDERLMGRWYREPSRHELHRAAGRRPLSIEVKVVAPGVFEVPSGRWREAVANHEGLVQDSRIVIALPASA